MSRAGDESRVRAALRVGELLARRKVEPSEEDQKMFAEAIEAFARLMENKG